MKNSNHVDVFKNKSTGKKVAVVGGGAQGLTAAYFLARLGHEPEIFEVMPKLGGILRYVISKDRLPNDVLDWEIKGILEMGVKFQTNKLIGKDFTINTLFKQGHDAILFTNGGTDSRKIVRGADKREQSIPGTFLMFDFLADAMSDRKPRIGKRVFIIEGGESALTTASLCKKLGAEQVTIITNNNRLTSKTHQKDIKVLLNTDVVSLKGNADYLTHLEIQDYQNESSQLIEADTIILGLGRLPELVLVPAKEENTWQTVKTFNGFSTQRKANLFSTIEPGRISDFTAVVKAVGAGRKISSLLHNYLINEELLPQENLVSEKGAIQNVSSIHDVISELRNIPENMGNNKEDVPNTQVSTLGFTEQVAVKEASRCLDCGLICYKKTKYKL